MYHLLVLCDLKKNMIKKMFYVVFLKMSSCPEVVKLGFVGCKWKKNDSVNKSKYFDLLGVCKCNSF